MNNVLQKAIEIMNKADNCFKIELPHVDINNICTLSDIWDGEGDIPDSSYSYQISDSGEDGESNFPIWINYEWNVIQEMEDILDTKIRITNIQLL